MIRKSEYLDWKQNDVTKEAAKDVAKTAENVVSELVQNLDNSHAIDMYWKGYLRGIQALMEWEPEFEEVENAED